MRISALSAGAIGALLFAVAGVLPAAANLDDEPREIDRAVPDNNGTDSGRAIRQARLLFYQTQPALLRYLLSTIEGRVVLYRYWLFRPMYLQPKPPAAGPAPYPEPQPSDLPAESVLDEIEDNGPLTMIGEQGSTMGPRALDQIGASAPPPVSILDEIDDSHKPAVNQAAPPPVRQR